MYRPDDWDKIIQEGVDWLDKNGFSSSLIDDDYASGYWEGVEKGADVILEALKKEPDSRYVVNYGGKGALEHPNGWVVFIQDKD